MTEEEKKAIEYMKEFQKDLYGASIKNLMASYLDTIFNLINKQQEEIEELNLQNIELKQQKIIDNCSIPTQKNFNEYYNYISKDKIREKIKEIENEHTGSTRNALSVLQELLDE